MNKFKVILILLAFLIGSECVNAQIVIGVKGGANFAKLPLVTSNDADDLKYRIGFHAGAYGMFALGYGDFIIQPELLYSQKGTRDYRVVFSEGLDGTYDLRLNYLSMPVMFGYYPFGNFRIEAGPQLGYLLNAKYQFEDQERVKLDLSQENLNRWDWGLAFGLVYDWPGPGTVGARYVRGISEVSYDINIETGETHPRRNDVLQVFITFPIKVINRGKGCPTFGNEIDLESSKRTKTKSGLLPKDGKKYWKKNGKTLKK